MLSRGFENRRVGFVINYSITNTQQKDSYLHKNSRVGRHEDTGVSITLIDSSDTSASQLKIIAEMETYLNRKFVKFD